MKLLYFFIGVVDLLEHLVRFVLKPGGHIGKPVRMPKLDLAPASTVDLIHRSAGFYFQFLVIFFPGSQKSLTYARP